MPKARKSTAMLADGAFTRLVKLTRRKGLPEWPTAAAVSVAMWAPGQGPTGRGWHAELTNKEHDQLVKDYRTVEDALGDIPWRWAYKVAT